MSGPPTLNPNSFRLPFQIETIEDVASALRYHASGITDINQAITALKTQLENTKQTINNVTNTTSGGGMGPTPNPFPFLGTVNDQRGVTSYTTQLTDNGAKIVVADSSAISIHLAAGVTTPWFVFIDNDSSANATLLPSSGSVIGESVIPGNGFGIVFFDGVNWFSGATLSPSNGLTATIVTAALTTLGTMGSMTFANGKLISQVSAT